MRVSRMPLSAALLLLLAGVPCRAQYLAPVAVRRLATAAATHQARDVAASRDTLADGRREISRVGAIVGGVAGGVAGAYVGLEIAANATRNCRGEFCGFGEALLGLGLGESIGLAVGAHVGSRSDRHENIFITSLASAGILVAGTYAGVMLGPAGEIMVPLTPMLQLAAAVAIESH
jgi:hypothetical protein